MLEVAMATVQVPFHDRLRKIVRNHQLMANGVTHRVTKDGLIVARPRLYKPKFPLRGLVLLVVSAFLFKGYILATLGAVDYDTRVASLSDGTVIEQAGAWVMQSDRLTIAVADVMRGFGL
jgi:hypothetical protein